MKSQKLIYRILMALLALQQKQIIYAQNNSLSILYDCGSPCLDLQINGGYQPYDVEWYHRRPNGYVLVNGW